MIKQFLSSHKFIILLLVLAFLLRMYKFQELFYYGHDNDLAGWFIKDIVVNRHPRLIGQETSTRGIFIGPLFYYLQIPFYLMTFLDPIGATLLVALLGTFAVWSVYYTFTKMWDSGVGRIGAIIYATSFYTLLNDREVVPTMPVILWSVWYLYALFLLLKGKQKSAFPLIGILLGLIWHLNFALILVTPLIPISFLMSRIKVLKAKQKARFIDVKSLIFGIFLCLFLSLPLIVFEFRHGFVQFNSLLSALTTDQKDVISGIDKWIRTFYLASKNVTGLISGSLINIPFEVVHIFVLGIFLLLLLRKKINWKMGIVMALWLFLYISFFSLYSKVLSEYYLNGMIVIYIAILAIAFSSLISSHKWRYAGFAFLAVFIAINLYRFFTIPINRSGYIDRKAIISEIKKDSEEKGYDCVSLSFIVDPGNDLGYRYFTWREGLKTKPVSDTVPVYTIIFPLKPVFKEDKAIGAIGLIYPEYSRYNIDTVRESCQGENSNLTSPMFGYTE